MKDEQDKMYLKKIKKFQKKLNEMEKRKLQIELNKKEAGEKLHKFQLEKFERIKDNLLMNKEENEEFRDNVLEYQREFIFNRPIKKDDAIEVKKNNARETIVLDNLERDKKIFQFNKDIYKIQEQSMLKLSNEKRRIMYNNLLKEEAERKKKELEDKEK